ncbi:hypothetical protein C478_03667 [Natrinema thermotolerans DSM 11552]|uniref:hypothetical protein n=1 Tax=Natrinema sp. H-ect1 TaxID=3242700 RepID=UPI0002B0F051|nr:hypothetical protein C478_03667 [Natrinema thermotolerans DSM 11552]
MATDRDSRRFESAGLVFEFLFALFVGTVVYVEWWDGAVPPLPDTVVLLIAVGSGLALGGMAAVLDDRRTVRTGAWRRGLRVAVAVVGGGFVLGTIVVPDGLPVAVELGVLAVVWGSVAGKFLLRIGPD